MGISSAEKQRRYRQRHLIDGNAERISIVVQVTTKRALERLARHRGTTQRAVLEDLLAKAEAAATRPMSPAAQKVYFDGE